MKRQGSEAATALLEAPVAAGKKRDLASYSFKIVSNGGPPVIVLKGCDLS